MNTARDALATIRSLGSLGRYVYRTVTCAWCRYQYTSVAPRTGVGPHERASVPRAQCPACGRFSLRVPIPGTLYGYVWRKETS